MKKIIIPTLAIVASVLYAGSASAETKFNITGGMNFYLSFANVSNVCIIDDKNDANNGSATSKDRCNFGDGTGTAGVAAVAAVEDDPDTAEDETAAAVPAVTQTKVGSANLVKFNTSLDDIVFSASSTTESGLTYGVTFKISDSDLGGSDANFKPGEVYADISGSSWGKLQIGLNDGAEDVYSNSGFSDLSGVDGDAPSRALKVNRAGNNNAPSGMGGFSGDSGDAPKISYFSPNFLASIDGAGSLEAGVSLSLDNKSVANAGGVSTSQYAFGIGIGAKYGITIGEVSISTGLGFGVDLTSKKDSAGKQAEALPMGLGVGLNVGFGSLKWGLGYATSIAKINCTYVDGKAPTGDGTCLSTHAVTTGISYGFGAVTLGVDTLIGMVPGIPIGDKTGTDLYAAVGLALQYDVAPGFNVFANLKYSLDIAAKAAGAGTNYADSNTIGLAVGTSVSF